ncbi:MAG TPA: hypothetical protein VKE98_18190 [Gemmataceae bacterium]|nr:hypothetical protein [Gemmataceae bacterium]
MRRFEQLPYAQAARGPKHPDEPDRSFAKEVSALPRVYPHIRKDPGYFAFLECYSGAGIYPPDFDHPPYNFMTIYGLGEYDDPDSPALDSQGYHCFCTSFFNHPERREDIHYSFALDATGKRPNGVYRSIGTKTNWQWYCGSFLEWLAIVVERKGRLLVFDSKGLPM